MEFKRQNSDALDTWNHSVSTRVGFQKVFGRVVNRSSINDASIQTSVSFRATIAYLNSKRASQSFYAAVTSDSWKIWKQRISTLKEYVPSFVKWKRLFILKPQQYLFRLCSLRITSNLKERNCSLPCCWIITRQVVERKICRCWERYTTYFI